MFQSYISMSEILWEKFGTWFCRCFLPLSKIWNTFSYRAVWKWVPQKCPQQKLRTLFHFKVVWNTEQDIFRFDLCAKFSFISLTCKAKSTALMKSILWYSIIATKMSTCRIVAYSIFVTYTIHTRILFLWLRYWNWRHRSSCSKNIFNQIRYRAHWVTQSWLDNPNYGKNQ